MTERRRVLGPGGQSFPPLFKDLEVKNELPILKREMSRIPALYVRTEISPSASGSAYLEREHHSDQYQDSTTRSETKLLCTVHGPTSLPRSESFSPLMIISACVKYSPFAYPQRTHVRRANERDLSSQLENALRGSIITECWPKSGVIVIVTVIESTADSSYDFMSDCITVASAALADAGIDCIDMASGGACPLSQKAEALGPGNMSKSGVCSVAVLPHRDEIMAVHIKGVGLGHPSSLKMSIKKAVNVNKVVKESLSNT